MELLLILSAMFAGLTGLISGDRALEPPQVERAAVALVAATAQAAPIEEARKVAVPRPSAEGGIDSGRVAFARAAEARSGGLAAVDERRLE